MKTGCRSSHEWERLVVAMAIAAAVLGCSLPGVMAARTPAPAGSAESVAACLEGILPGKTTKNEVVSLLGYPLATEQEQGIEIIQYASAIYGQYNSIDSKNQVVTRATVVQAADKPLRWSEIKAQLGEPAFRAYTNYQQGSMTYAYPDRGRAYIADETMDVVFIQQCFVPMSVADYMTAYGNSMPTEDPFIE